MALLLWSQKKQSLQLVMMVLLWLQKKQSFQLVMMALLWSPPPDDGAAVEAQEIES